MKPFLSWAGSKYSVINEVLSHIPDGGRLIDVFAGSGSIFMNAGFERNLVGDINQDLINLFIATSDDVEGVIECASEMFELNSGEDGYYEIRSSFNEGAESLGDIVRAAQFLFLNKNTFNGLFRRNLKGEFNCPWGKRKSVYFPESELRDFSELASKCEFICAPYAVTIGKAEAGDIVVCDPPYQPLPGEDGFTAYSGASWDFLDQEMLVDSMLLAHTAGAKLVIMNSGAELVRELYADNGFSVHDLPTRRSIGKARFVANDIIAVKL